MPLYDELMNAGLPSAQAFTIANAITGGGGAPTEAATRDALIQCGLDSNAAGVLANRILAGGGGGGGTVTAASITDATAVGRAILTAIDAAAQRTALGLGTAATQSSTAFATAAQGATADTALQPSSLKTVGGANLVGTGDIPVGGALGPYANLSALIAAKPAASSAGQLALVGAAAPYQQYSSNGSTWELVGNTARVAPQYRMRRMWADAAAKTGKRRILCVGDSTTAHGSGVYGSSWPVHLKNILAGMGMPVQDGSLFSTHAAGGYSGTWAYDNRVVFSATGITHTGFAFGTFSMAAGGTITFTPAEPFTNFRFYYLVNSAATVSYQIDGGAANNLVFTTTGSPTWAFTDVSGIALGNHTIQLNHVSGSPNVIGLEVWNAADPKASIINAGQSAMSLQLLQNPGSGWTVAKAMAAWAPDVIILEMGTNDYPYTTAQFETSLSAFITDCNTNNVQLILGVFPPNNGWGDGNIANADAKRDIVRKLASANGIPMVDLHRRWGSAFATMNSLGFYTDAVHATSAGAWDKAMAYAQALMSLPNYSGT